jgi:hypothetical protein
MRRSRSKQGAHPDAQNEHFPSSDMGVAEQRRAEEGSCLACIPVGKERFNSEGTNVRRRQGQRGNWSKQDTTFPTLSTDLVFIAAVKDTYKGHKVTCFDIPGAFLHAELDKDNTMILKERPAKKLMVQIAPNLNRKYITVNK